MVHKAKASHIASALSIADKLSPDLCRLKVGKELFTACGMSLVDLLEDDSLPAKSAVFTRYHQAEAIRTDQYTFTQWFWNDGGLGPRMLYDNINDPDETRNLAELAEYRSTVNNLSSQLTAYIKNRK